MATYNGAKYLPEQLESIAGQQLMPDQLVVADDASSDGTIGILENFAQTAAFKVDIVRNTNNLGYAKNFERALGMCTGDLILLCDQDDVWMPNKVEQIWKHAKAYPEIMLFMNDAELTNGNGTPLGLTKLGQTLSLGMNEDRFTTGCCMALRKSFVEFALPIPESNFVHDTWLNHLAILLQVKMVITNVLQYYRRHGNNASEWIASRIARQRPSDLVRAYRDKNSAMAAQRRLLQLAHLRERIQGKSLSQSSCMAVRTAWAHARIEHERRAIESRIRLLRRDRRHRMIPAAAFYLRGQYRFFSGWKSFVKDLVFQR